MALSSSTCTGLSRPKPCAASPRRPVSARAPLRGAFKLRAENTDASEVSTITVTSSVDALESKVRGGEAAASTSTPAPAASSGGSNGGGIAAGAAVAAVIAFAVGRLFSGGPSLAMLQEQSVPLEVALRNEKPTVIEFYANWCEVCRELVAEEYQVEKQYHDNINFVMLNIENSKWAPEIAEFGVGGIPHFVFMDSSNQPLAAAVGRLPQQVLEGNVAALAEGRDLPFTRARGQTSSMSPVQQGAMSGPRQANPRDHA